MTRNGERAAERGRIVRNAASSYGSRLLLALSALLLTPYLFRSLGTAGFGTWSVIFTIATVFSLVELGFTQGVAKFVAEYRAQGRRGDLEATIGSAFIALIGASLLAVAFTVAMGAFADGLAADGDGEAFRLGLLLVGAGTLVQFPCLAYGAALQGLQRYDLYYVSDATRTTGFVIGAVVAIESGSGVLGLAIAWAGSSVVAALLFCVFLARAERGLRLLPRARDLRLHRQITTFGSLTTLADSMTFIAARMDTLVIAAVRNAATAAPFAAALKLQSGLQSLTLPFLTLLMPMFSDLRARGHHEEVARRFALGTRVALQLTLPVAFGLALFAPEAVDLWLGPDAPEVTADIIVLLMAAQTISITSTPAEKLLVGVGRVKAIGALAVVEGCSNLALSIVLIHAYGAIGAALGTLMTSGVLTPIKVPLACRATGARPRDFLLRGVLPAVLSSLPGIAAMVAAYELLPEGSLRLLGGLAVGLGLCASVGIGQVGIGRLAGLARSLTGERGRRALQLDSDPPAESPIGAAP